MRPFLLLPLLVACTSKAVDTSELPVETPTDPVDADGDGVSVEDGDCDDADKTTFPGSAETCDGVDNNCDGGVDEGLLLGWYADLDSDGYGDAATLEAACEPSVGWVSNGADCDDADAEIYPGAPELCDGIDNDCDGVADLGVVAWYADADDDGYGDALQSIDDCEQPDGYASLAGDCDDADPAWHPGAAETCDDPNDYNCDGSVGYADADGDGTAACSDCDDSNADVSPIAPEVCNGLDDDCDTLVDDADADLDTTTTSVWYADGDGDGYGDPDAPTATCDTPAGFVADNLDCDDTRSDVSPAATEVCNGIDDDCDAAIDDDDPSLDTGSAATWYADADADGYGDVTVAVTACIAPADTVADDQDCDDTDAAVSPAATEVCNGIDDDCNGVSDDADSGLDTSSADTWYSDVDGDGYGDATTAGPRCEPGVGDVGNGDDCDDTDADVSPAAIEVCDFIDNDCDGDIDDADTSLDPSGASAWYTDNDGDGYGDPAASSLSCSGSAGEVGNGDDCDDTDLDVSPSAVELCNGVDDDCDGTADDGLSTSTWYEDNDGDGYGETAVTDCVQPADTVANDYDCDDTDAAVFPGASAMCPWPSCLELLNDGIASTDGSYWIDFDGVATETECDMTTDGGGWTLIFDDDFESTPAAGWSASATYACGAWTTMLGGYNILSGGSVSISASTYAITHTEVWVELNYLKLDSWDGETASISIDGTDLWTASLYYYEGSEVCGWNRGWSGSYDQRYPLSQDTTHTGASILFAATSTLDQGPSDESFGIDDVFLWIR